MKTKDNIEGLILKNLEGLNENEPLDGHFERFEAKLKSQKKNKKIIFNAAWKVAAAVIFILLATNQAYIYLSPNQHSSIFNAIDKEITLASVSEEYVEVEYYYSNAINVGLDQWNTLTNEGHISDGEQKMMDAELIEFEERFKSLQKDLAANPNDERVINAMLEYYQAKLSLINMIVNKLEEVKQTNKNQNVEI